MLEYKIKCMLRKINWKILCVILIAIIVLAQTFISLNNIIEDEPKKQALAEKDISKSNSISEDIDISMSSDATQIKKGEEIYINLYITGDEIASMSGYLHYDKTVFKEIKSKNWEIPEALQDEDNGDWSAKYTSANEKVVIEEASGEKFEIPNDGLLVQLKLEVLQDSESETIEIKKIEVDGSRK